MKQQARKLLIDVDQRGMRKQWRRRELQLLIAQIFATLILAKHAFGKPLGPRWHRGAHVAPLISPSASPAAFLLPFIGLGRIDALPYSRFSISKHIISEE
jgi:hypothetical protein